MNELSVVRLKDDYVFFQEDEYICVYRKSTKLVMLKLKAGKNAWNDAVKEDLNRPHQVQWLAKQPYWNWLGLLMLKYQDLFEELSEAETDRAVQKSDFFSVVNPTHFAEGFQADTSFRQTKIYLWGVTALNMLLYETLKETIPAACVIRKEEDLADVNSFAGLDGEKRMEAAIPEEQIIAEKDMTERSVGQDDLFLIDGTGLDADRLAEINDFIVERKAVALFYNSTKKAAVIGPLVIGGESACLRCMQSQDVLTEYYPGENSFLDQAVWHLFAFFIIRTLYYIKDRNLYYLLSDAQIPINKVMTISRDDITAKMKYLHRDVSCACCK